MPGDREADRDEREQDGEDDERVPGDRGGELPPCPRGDEHLGSRGNIGRRGTQVRGPRRAAPRRAAPAREAPRPAAPPPAGPRWEAASRRRARLRRAEPPRAAARRARAAAGPARRSSAPRRVAGSAPRSAALPVRRRLRWGPALARGVDTSASVACTRRRSCSTQRGQLRRWASRRRESRVAERAVEPVGDQAAPPARTSRCRPRAATVRRSSLRASRERRPRACAPRRRAPRPRRRAARSASATSASARASTWDSVRKRGGHARARPPPGRSGRRRGTGTGRSGACSIGRRTIPAADGSARPSVP